MNKTIQKKLDKLDLDLRNLLTDLDGYSENTLNKKPDENSWSVFQIMNHMILAERYSLGYVQKKLSFNPELKNAGVLSKMRRMFVNTYLQSPLKIKAPPGISGENLPAHSTFWEVAKNWKDSREKMRAYLGTLPQELFKKELYKHPLAGKMSLADMLSFLQSHYDNHLRQIHRTLRKIDAVKIK